jgi:hypothetical protein
LSYRPSPVTDDLSSKEGHIFRRGSPRYGKDGKIFRVTTTKYHRRAGVSPAVSDGLEHGARLLEMMDRPLLLADGTHNELAPRKLPLSSGARCLWIGFHDHVETRLGAGGELEPVRGLANKLPEHAARIAAVLALVHNISAGEVGSGEMEAGIVLAQHYASEAMRLFGGSRISGELREAQQLLTWLQTSWGEPFVSLPDIYQYGPNSIRDKSRAQRAVTLLADHGHLVTAPAGEVAGTYRREVWGIVKG